MNRYRPNPIFVTVLFLCAAAMTVELWDLRACTRRVTRLGKLLESRRTELAALARHTPVLNRQTTEALNADIGAAEKRLAMLRTGLHDASPVRPVPAQSRESYLVLNAAVGRLRASAERHAVHIAPDERFGFSGYARTGPDPALIEPVHRQLRLVEELIACLLESRPSELRGVRRERPVADAPGARRQADEIAGAIAEEGNSPDDHFVSTIARNAGDSDLVRTDMFRLEFGGETRVLRDFLNALAAHRTPFLVRSVEVEPDSEGSDSSTPPAALVRRHPSRFAVVVAAVELLPVKATP